MKKAVTLSQYSDVRGFSQPAGVVDVQLDKVTNRLATPSCPDDYTAAFIVGTEPNETCDRTGGVGGFFSHMFGLGGDKALPPLPVGSPPGTEAQDPQKKKGFFGKVADLFRDEKKPNKTEATPSNQSGTPTSEPH
jgi:penicillin-binding protein 1B